MKETLSLRAITSEAARQNDALNISSRKIRERAGTTHFPTSAVLS
jgi:hypothetical protein